MKFLVLLLVLAIAAGWVFVRGRQRKPPPRATPPSTSSAPKVAAEMLACAHCGVHLPRVEAAFDVAGRPFCTPEHRIAGPV